MMNGFLIIDKKAGMSSYDVIRRLKRLERFRKIGYIGTLDRNATGILPVALNEGVKLIPFLENVEKAYRASFLLGVSTDTFDIEGRITAKADVGEFDRKLIENVLNEFKGKIVQRVPVYSSKKVNRKPLYKWARQGLDVDPPEKEVEIFAIEFLDYRHPYVDLEVTCSKGTYIRALANDFGTKLGCGATLHSLKRTRQGEFTEDMGIDIDYFKSPQDLINYLLSLENVLQSVRGIVVETALERFLKNGMPIPLTGNSKEWKNGELARLLNKQGVLIGIGSADPASRTIKIKRLINN
ncbi:MAG TPA: tRNA pseudouridine(55) synthase TruB [Syntrophorhabdaceae bacterium]|nr:tRNA pseudouridine(55) synthase TruB [Syntrophorhabdaceae bacterium]HQM81965.1 tRNA pseudouridine(55) synthase TruB [Syntrophorhabdaceae bacterium]